MKQEYRYEITLPGRFSHMLIHDGVGELGFIEDETASTVLWSLTEREIFAMLSDAKDIVTRQKYRVRGENAFYYGCQDRYSAQRAIDKLEVFISANNLHFQVP